VSSPALRIRAGKQARAHLLSHGLRPKDIQVVTAAAGGPKGLILFPLDNYLFSDFLNDDTERLLVGSSIGAWRMAAATQTDCTKAFERLANAYVSAEILPTNFHPRDLTRLCEELIQVLIKSEASFFQHQRPERKLLVVAAKARGPLAQKDSKTAFLRAALVNARSRAALGKYFERVVFHSANLTPSSLTSLVPNDQFGLSCVSLDAGNLVAALMATGTIPTAALPVQNPLKAPPGYYWDGGMVDYHFAWPTQAQTGLTLLPHFSPSVTAGWLDKHLPWRKHGIQGEPTLFDRLVVLYPCPEYVKKHMPLGRIPDRQDVQRFKAHPPERLSHWRKCLSQSEAFAHAFAQMAGSPSALRAALDAKTL
jgi:hypothetical protein